jgi:hypothetical protein
MAWMVYPDLALSVVCGVIERGLELLLEEKGLADSRLKKNGQRLMLKYLSLDSYH